MSKKYDPDYVAEVTEDLTVYVFDDQHRYIEHDDSAEIICPEASDIYHVRSNLGNKDYYCPGCGSLLDPNKKSGN